MNYYMWVKNLFHLVAIFGHPSSRNFSTNIDFFSFGPTFSCSCDFFRGCQKNIYLEKMVYASNLFHVCYNFVAPGLTISFLFILSDLFHCPKISFYVCSTWKCYFFAGHKFFVTHCPKFYFDGSRDSFHVSWKLFSLDMNFGSLFNHDLFHRCH